MQVAAKAAQTPYKTFATFSQAVDEFFSARESQKLDVRAKQQEKAAVKKLQNIERDHEQRLKALDVSGCFSGDVLKSDLCSGYANIMLPEGRTHRTQC